MLCVKAPAGVRGATNVFCLVGRARDRYFLSAETRAEMRGWVEDIRLAIRGGPPSPPPPPRQTSPAKPSPRGLKRPAGLCDSTLSLSPAPAGPGNLTYTYSSDEEEKLNITSSSWWQPQGWKIPTASVTTPFSLGLAEREAGLLLLEIRVAHERALEAARGAEEARTRVELVLSSLQVRNELGRVELMPAATGDRPRPGPALFTNPLPALLLPSKHPALYPAPAAPRLPALQSAAGCPGQQSHQAAGRQPRCHGGVTVLPILVHITVNKLPKHGEYIVHGGQSVSVCLNIDIRVRQLSLSALPPRRDLSVKRDT